MSTKIIADKPFTVRDAQTGELTSIGCGEIATVDDSLAEAMISAGNAAAYTLITPTGNIEIKENTEEGETIDVSAYATATVAVPMVGGGK